MGLIVIKAIKPAAEDNEIFGSAYALTPIPIAVDNGGVKYFVSYDTQAVASMSIGIQAGMAQYFFSHGVANEASMTIGVQSNSLAQVLSQPTDTAGVVPISLRNPIT